MPILNDLECYIITNKEGVNETCRLKAYANKRKKELEKIYSQEFFIIFEPKSFCDIVNKGGKTK